MPSHKGRLLASRQVSVSECSVEWKNVGHRYEFAQRDCLLRAYTAREDDILPYIGWVAIRPAKFQIFFPAVSKTIMLFISYRRGFFNPTFADNTTAKLHGTGKRKPFSGSGEKFFRFSPLPK